MLRNENCVDMHIHSTASDGALVPRECIKKAIDHGISKLSLTDHDTIAGYSELEENYDGIKIISGVELSAEYEKELHILGYGFDKTAEPICNIFSQMKKERLHRNKCIIEKLNKTGVAINYDEIINSYDSDTFGRVHIAKELIKKGYVKDINEAFEKYLSRGKAAYCKRSLPSKQGCIDAIKKSGGIAVLAHPIFLSLHRSDLIRFIDELKEIGLDGVEAYHCAQDAPYSSYIVNICKDRKLLCTAGTDTHGFKHEVYSPPVIKDEFVLNCINKIFGCS